MVGVVMGIPFDKIAQVLRAGVDLHRDADESIRVAVFVDDSASPFLVSTLRDALVPQTPSALVRVDLLEHVSCALKDDTDVALVISCGSAGLQQSVQQIVVAGVPTVVLSESSVEVPFIEHDTRMLGLIAATDAAHLLESLARWVLERTDKDVAFARNFPFMRIAASMRAISSASVANLTTGALAFIPGADFPVMTLAQAGMMLKLATIHDKPIKGERLYEFAGLVVSALAMRTFARALCSRVPKGAFAVKALVGGAGTFALGLGFNALYEHNVDYSPLNDLVRRVAGGLRQAARHDSMQRDDMPIANAN